jgi:hypothetical protein
MIAITLEGRLGNQLFQYAFIYAQSKRLHTSFYLDKSVEDFMLPKYFEVENDFLATLDNRVFYIKGYKNIFTVHAKKVFYNLLNKIILGNKTIVVSNETTVKDAFSMFKNNRLYKGYFQSESYFIDFKEEIRTLYKIKKKYSGAFEQVINQFNASKKKAVIHIRRSDYVDLDIALPVSYYKKAIEIIDDTNIEYIFVSDDPSFIETEFSFIPNKYVSTYNEIIDLQFLINADICILSNSSFSWWGAWLNNNKNKQVFAPKYWIGYKENIEFPTGISDYMNINWIGV